MVEAAEAVTETHGTKPLRVGLDIGSTTVKAVVLDQSDALEDALFSDYRRHHANVRATVAGLLADIHQELEKLGRGDEPIRLAITGSGGLALADSLDVPFVQEVYATLDADDQARYRKLLECEDQDMFGWFMERSESQDPELQRMVRMILDRVQPK